MAPPPVLQHRAAAANPSTPLPIHWQRAILWAWPRRSPPDWPRTSAPARGARAHPGADGEARGHPSRHLGAPRDRRRQPHPGGARQGGDRAPGVDRGADRGPADHRPALPAGALRARRQGDGTIRQLLPDPIPGMVIDRMEIPRRGPHRRRPAHARNPRVLDLRVAARSCWRSAGEQWTRRPGRRGGVSRATSATRTRTRAARPAVGYSVVVLARV